MNINTNYKKIQNDYFVKFEATNDAGKLVRIEHMVSGEKATGLTLEEIYTKAWSEVQESFVYNYNLISKEEVAATDPTNFNPPASVPTSIKIIGPDQIKVVSGVASPTKYQAEVYDQYGKFTTANVKFSLKQTEPSVVLTNDTINITSFTATNGLNVTLVATAGEISSETNIYIFEALRQIKDEKINELNRKCSENIIAGFTSSALGSPHLYQFDAEAQRNLTGTKSLLADFPDGTTFPWKTDKGEIEHTKAQITQVCLDSFDHVLSNTTKYRTKKNQVESSISKAEISAIIWE